MFLPSSRACALGLACPSIRASFSFRGVHIVLPPLPQVEVKQQEEPAGEGTGGSHPTGGFPALAVEKVSGGW